MYLISWYADCLMASESTEMWNADGGTSVELMVSRSRHIEMSKPKTDVKVYRRPLFICNAAYILWCFSFMEVSLHVNQYKSQPVC